MSFQGPNLAQTLISGDTWSWSWDDYLDVASELSVLPDVVRRVAPGMLAPTRQPVANKVRSKRPLLGGASRVSGGRASRFIGHFPAKVSKAECSLPSSHRAVVEGRTMFRKSVVAAADSPRILVSGHNQAKLGARVEKGRWRGMPIFHVTLEERATCPRSCALWSACYGNSMPFARRHSAGPEMEAKLWDELRATNNAHPLGFLVRLHGLGDFYSRAYVDFWLMALIAFPGLRVWGYTAHPRESEIGERITSVSRLMPARWFIRSSVRADDPAGPMQATTIWRPEATGHIAEGFVCPAQTDDTRACATCGLCWSPAFAATRVVFLGHGNKLGNREEDLSA